MPAAIPPTSDTRAVADFADMLVARFLEARHSINPLGRVEADIEALNLIYLMIRHVEGVACLSREDLALLPPALVASRAAFEAGVRALWLLQPLDPFDRDARYLAHLRTEESFRERRLRDATTTPPPATAAALASIRSFRTAVEAALPPHIKRIPQAPRFDRMLAAVGIPEFYDLYAFLSQTAHGTHIATHLFRKHLGSAKVIGEFITPSAWSTPFRTGISALLHAGSQFLTVKGGSVARFCPPDLREYGYALLDALESTTAQTTS